MVHKSGAGGDILRKIFGFTQAGEQVKGSQILWVVAKGVNGIVEAGILVNN